MAKDKHNHFADIQAAAGKIPLIRRLWFIYTAFAALAVCGALLFGVDPHQAGMGILAVIYSVVLAVWTVAFTFDAVRPTWVKNTAAFLVLALLACLFIEFKVEDSHQVVDLFFNAGVIKKAWPYLVLGFWTTIKLAVCAAILSTVLGVTLAVFQSFNNRVLNFFIIIYVDVFRAIPLIVLLMLIYYGLPFMHIRLNAFASGVLGLGLNSSSYVSEIFRAGFKAVDKGQKEASRALGLNPWQTVIKVLLPQAARAITPPLVGNYVSSAKDTALCSSISIIELLKAGTAQQSLNTNPSPLIFVAVLYLIMFLPLTRLTGYLESRMKRKERTCHV